MPFAAVTDQTIPDHAPIKKIVRAIREAGDDGAPELALSPFTKVLDEQAVGLLIVDDAGAVQRNQKILVASGGGRSSPTRRLATSANSSNGVRRSTTP
jgi:hypothetical protein